MKKLFSALLSLCILMGICCPELSAYASYSSKQKSSDPVQDNVNYLEGVVNASELFYINGVVFWGYGDQLCSALVDDSGQLYDFVSEGTLSSGVSYVAMADSVIYMSTDAGIIALPTEQAGQDKSYLGVLDEHDLSGGFQIYDGMIYYRYGTTLYSLPCSGGDSSKLEKEIECFQVTTRGIYCLNEDGELILLSLDGKERRRLLELDCEGDLGIFGSKAYITTGDEDDYIYIYDLEKDSCEKLELEEELSPHYPVWVDGDDLYYRSSDSDIFRVRLSSGKETLMENDVALPDYDQGFLLDGFIYYEIADTLYWDELEGNTSRHIDSKDALSAGVSGAAGEDYDIARNIAVRSSQGLSRLESDHFTLYLPADGDWEYEVLNKRWVDINYAPARKAGYGGNVVSIAAYDMDDDSYTVFPNYAIAGEGGGKRYIAIFPTDVQFDKLTEQGWRELSDYVKNIDLDNKDNPFSCN